MATNEQDLARILMNSIQNPVTANPTGTGNTQPANSGAQLNDFSALLFQFIQKSVALVINQNQGIQPNPVNPAIPMSAPVAQPTQGSNVLVNIGPRQGYNYGPNMQNYPQGVMLPTQGLPLQQMPYSANVPYNPVYPNSTPILSTRVSTPTSTTSTTAPTTATQSAPKERRTPVLAQKLIKYEEVVDLEASSYDTSKHCATLYLKANLITNGTITPRQFSRCLHEGYFKYFEHIFAKRPSEVKKKNQFILHVKPELGISTVADLVKAIQKALGKPAQSDSNLPVNSANVQRQITISPSSTKTTATATSSQSIPSIAPVVGTTPTADQFKTIFDNLSFFRNQTPKSAFTKVTNRKSESNTITVPPSLQPTQNIPQLVIPIAQKTPFQVVELEQSSNSSTKRKREETLDLTSSAKKQKLAEPLAHVPLVEGDSEMKKDNELQLPNSL